MLKTLRAPSARFLDAMAGENKTLVRAADAARVTGHAKHQAAVFLGQLARRGLLTRLGRGLYALVPFGKDHEFGNPFLVASALVGKDQHFVSHLGAMSFHNLLLQPSRTLHVSVVRPHAVREVGPMRYRFVIIPRKSLWGFRHEWVTPTDRVPISDPERTIVDGCWRPDLCGGIVEVARALWLCRERLDRDRLLQYVRRFGKYVVAKRVGFLLETLQLDAGEIVSSIHHYASESRPYSNLDTILPTEGELNSRWRLRLNVSADELVASTRS
jgi:predicted transcriptional regulator of viral defense system